MTNQSPPAVGNELFLHNMRALWREDPALALAVDAVADDERVALEPTRSGAWTAKMITPSGSAAHLHSRYDPWEEARRLIASVPTEDKFCFVVSGMGLGYHVRQLYDSLRGDAIIVCFEPSIPLIASALTCVDLSEAISAKRLIVLTSDDKTRLHERLKPYNTLIMLGTQFVQHPTSQRVAEGAHAAMTAAMAEFVTFTRMTLVTMVANSKITCKNIAMNLVNYVTTPPIDLLRGRFAGDPAVIVSAGPSLSRNIDQLADLKGRAVLCAVQTAVQPLMRRGIVPDFVTSLDFHEMSQKFFEGVDSLADTHLVAEPKATWGVVDKYPGPVSLLANDWAGLVIGNELARRDGLPPGATVAHLAFYLAVYMGCDPVVFVGQDLAFTGHAFYVPGVEIHQTWRSELNRFVSMEQKEWDRIVRNRPILRKVQGIDGGELFTDELLFTYLEQFEKDIADVPCRVIDATEGGARIRGTQPMPLREVAARFCREQIDPARLAYRQTTKWRDSARLAATRAQLERRIAELDDVIALCNELLELFKELSKLTDDPPRFNQRLVRVDELRTKVQQESRAYRIVASATQLAELRRYSADRRIEAADKADDAKRAQRQIERDTEFITGVRDGAVDTKPVLTAALQRVVTAEEAE